MRSQVRSLSSRALVAAARRVSARYERYLQRSFPRFYVLHSTFKSGEPRGLRERGELLGSGG